MIKIVLGFVAAILCQEAFADPAVLYTAGLQTNPAANTVEANSGSLSCRGNTGCNYRITLILHSSNQMQFSFQALNGAAQVQVTVRFTIPGNDTKVIRIPSSFFIPNGWSVRVLNDNAQILGATSQATIIMEVVEVN